MTGVGLQSLFAVVVVLGLVVALAWLLRRGAFNALRPGSRSMTVETAVPLGDRRSLVIVAVEGRRLLLGLTPAQISMVTELGAAPPAPVEPGPGGSSPSFDQLLVARARDMWTGRGASSTNPGGIRRADLRETLVRMRDRWRRRRATAAVSNARFGDILQLSAHQS